jgi:hypothetical protein
MGGSSRTCLALHKVEHVRGQPAAPLPRSAFLGGWLSSRRLPAGRDKVGPGGRFAERTKTRTMAGGAADPGLSARALRARPTAHLPRHCLRSAAHPTFGAWLLHSTAAAQEMRRGGSRREPALSPGSAAGGALPWARTHSAGFPPHFVCAGIRQFSHLGARVSRGAAGAG